MKESRFVHSRMSISRLFAILSFITLPTQARDCFGIASDYDDALKKKQQELKGGDAS